MAAEVAEPPRTGVGPWSAHPRDRLVQLLKELDRLRTDPGAERLSRS